MKKIIVILVAGILATATSNAQVDSSQTEYRFYPEANVYFNPKTKTYSWFDQSTTRWTTGIQLPLNFKIKNEATFNTIRYPGTDIWSSNPDHMKTYGSKNNQIVPETTKPPAQ